MAPARHGSLVPMSAAAVRHFRFWLWHRLWRGHGGRKAPIAFRFDRMDGSHQDARRVCRTEPRRARMRRPVWTKCSRRPTPPLRWGS